MTAREVVESFWAAMRANDWAAAAGHFADDTVVDWPCTGERIPGPELYAEVLGRYPAAGRWRFDVHLLVADDDRAVTELTVSDDETAARAIFISDVVGDRITRQVEYWPTPYEPPDWRSPHLQRIESIP